MLPDGRRIGPHLPLGHGMAHAADRAAMIGADTLQVFSDNPTAWQRRERPPSELPAFRDRLAEHGLRPLVVHAPYLVNLAGSQEELWERSVALLGHELRVAETFGAGFVNVHVGSHRGRGVAAGIERVAIGVARALLLAEKGPVAASTHDQRQGLQSPSDRHPRVSVDVEPGSAPRDVPGALEAPVLVLENSPGSGDGLGIDIPELAGILEALARRTVDVDRVGFCLDTAHAWAAGIALDTPEAVDRFVRGFDAAIGLDRLRLVHLNDARGELGSRHDRHEHLGAGRIGAAGLGAILTHPSLGHVTYLLETPGMEDGFDAVNLDRAHRLARGEPLPPLPPEAKHVRPGRSRSTAGPPEEPDRGRGPAGSGS